MSLAVLCSQCFALRVTGMLSVIIDSPTPPSKRGSLAGHSPHCLGPCLLPYVPLNWTPGKGVLMSAVQFT